MSAAGGARQAPVRGGCFARLKAAFQIVVGGFIVPMSGILIDCR
jgi:hypothetical protein